jgi:CubicO group peptidase (beta-lactamase class C family)
VLSRFATEIASGVPTAGLWSYSNAGFCLLGRVIETVTGSVWEQAMRGRLLESAAMSGFTFVTGKAAPQRASGHDITPDGPAPVDPLITRTYGPAGTSAICSVSDLLRFARMHLEKPSLAILHSVQAEIKIAGWARFVAPGVGLFDWTGGPV